jgi:F-type H+-transporting ATPase subunit alpha
MKKVAGTLKLDQAQFRELEAFSKFGSDLDPTTKRTIERGRRNQEILKQKQYSPVRVELQVAIIYLSTKGFLDKIPVENVKSFESDFYNLISAQYPEALSAIKKGDLDTAGELLKKAVNELAPKYAKV